MVFWAWKFSHFPNAALTRLLHKKRQIGHLKKTETLNDSDHEVIGFEAVSLGTIFQPEQKLYISTKTK